MHVWAVWFSRTFGAQANLYSAAVVAELPATAPAPVRSVSDGAADDDFEDLRGASAPALVTLKLSSQQGYFDSACVCVCECVCVPR